MQHGVRIAALLGAVLIGGGAHAQVAGSPPAPPPGSETAIPEKIDPPQNGIVGPAPGETLSDHLDQNDGVLSPRGNPDPGMAVAPPDPGPGSTPVIPPPGSPGGDPTIQPK
jgi:hypothetical protein